MPSTATATNAETLRNLQAPGQFLVMPNAWDAASARAFARAGFPAIATTSGGVAQAIGFDDHENAPVDEMLEAAARIIRAVEIPVTVDFEAGYGLPPEEIAQRLIEIGAAGLNIEDSDHHSEALLVPAEPQAQRIAALREACRSAGAALVINARDDPFITRAGTREEQLAEGIRRGRLYLEAGADSIYPIGVVDEPTISALVEALGPLNVMMWPNASPPLARLRALGVRRVTYATGIFRRLYAQLDAEGEAIFNEWRA